jgi:hypothetical protein
MNSMIGGLDRWSGDGDIVFPSSETLTSHDLDLVSRRKRKTKKDRNKDPGSPLNFRVVFF